LQYARQLSYGRGLTERGGKLAQAYEHQGDFKAALAALDEALEANKKIPEELYFMPKNLSIKAEIQAKLGHKKEAETLYLKSADLIDVMLANSPTPNVERILISDLGYIYGDQFKLISDQRDYGKAFEVIEKARGRIETQSLEHHSAPRPHDPNPAEMKLNAMQLQLIDTDESKKRRIIMDEIYRTEIQQLDNGAIGTRAYAEPVTNQHLQRELRPDELLIEYVLQSPQSYALAVTCTSIERCSLPDKNIIESQAADYRKVIRDKKQQPDLAQRLFSELLGNIPEYKEKTAVIVISDGKLHLLPFSSLMDEKGNYTILTHTISTAPSGTVLSLLRDRSVTDTQRKPYLGVAAWTETIGNPGIFREILGGPSRSQLEPLPESRSEVESIGAMLPKPSIILLGSAATKARFEQLPLNEYEVVHLALHGYVDPEFPDRSALVFAPLTGGTSSDAGFLQVRGILRLHLHASLVTLSACDTGVGPVGEEGVDNVVEAFIQAGARSVVSTLGELKDRSTTHLMKDFYDHLTRGENKAEALRDAQVDLLHENASPYYWASFEVVGDPGGNLYSRTKNDTL